MHVHLLKFILYLVVRGGLLGIPEQLAIICSALVHT